MRLQAVRAARVTFGLVVLLSVLAWTTPAWPGGIWLYEMATPDQGTAAAGRAALALAPPPPGGTPPG
jgi:hypothetical protein